MRTLMIIVLYAIAGYGAYKLLVPIINNYLRRVESWGNDATRKYYERLHYAKMNTTNPKILLPVAITAIALVMIFWPITLLVTVIWNFIDFKLTEKEFKKD